MTSSVIALLTDFGEKDYFVASMKAVILSLNPKVQIVDIAHHIPPYDCQTAAFFLQVVQPYFSRGTIFLVVVDPGVGSKRKILLARTEKHFFIGPDNGVLSLAWEGAKRLEVREVREKRYFLPAPSRTFEGRDKMAPVAGWLSRGVPVDRFGPIVSTWEKIKLPSPEVLTNEIRGEVLHIDRFGNLITNIPGAEFEKWALVGQSGLFVQVAGKQRREASYVPIFAASPPKKLILLLGSTGFLEVALREDSAADKLKVRVRDKVLIKRKRGR